MPASPFGLAYGLGAGMSNIPQAYTQGQQQGMSLAMQNLQLQEMARQANERQKLNAEYARPIEAPMVPVTTTTEQPTPYTRPEDQFSAAGMSEAEGGEETEAPKTMGTTPVKTTEYKKKEWSTPYEKLAYETGVRADNMANMGAGLISNQLRQLQQQYQSQHLDTLGQLGAKYVSMGSESAIPVLRELGFQGAQKIITLPDGKTRAIQMEDGSVTPMSPGALAAMSAGGKIGDFLNHQQQWNMSYEGRLAAADARKYAAEEAGKSARYRADVGLQGVLARSNATISAAQIHANAPDAKSKFFGMLAQSVQAEHPDWDGEQIRTAVTNSGLWNSVKDNATAAASQVRQVAQARMKFYEQKYNGKEPPVGSEDRKEYDLWKQQAADVSSRMMEKVNKAPKAQAPQQSGGKKGITISGGKVTASTNPDFKVGMDAINSKGQTIADGTY